MTIIESRRIAVLGASGRVGRLVLSEALSRGHTIAAQTREAGRLAGTSSAATVVETDPADAEGLRRLMSGADAVIYALGVKSMGPTTFFSDTTRALLAAIETAGTTRLVALTGVGAGSTRGHGGALYDRLVFPLFTARAYRDKDRQEALIAASAIDWTILRPAPFSDRPGAAPLRVVEGDPPARPPAAPDRARRGRGLRPRLRRARAARAAPRVPGPPVTERRGARIGPCGRRSAWLSPPHPRTRA